MTTDLNLSRCHPGQFKPSALPSRGIAMEVARDVKEDSVDLVEDRPDIRVVIGRERSKHGLKVWSIVAQRRWFPSAVPANVRSQLLRPKSSLDRTFPDNTKAASQFNENRNPPTEFHFIRCETPPFSVALPLTETYTSLITTLLVRCTGQ